MRRLLVLLLALGCSGGVGLAQTSAAGRALVLIPGAGGIHPNDFLVMSQGYFQSAGFETDFAESAGQAARLIADKKARGMKVTLVGMSLGAVTAAQTIASGARPDGVVFAAGGLFPPGTPNGSVVETIGDPSVLPPTLVLHHRQDGCRFTPPEGVGPFVRWARGRARAHWISGGGGDGLPCRPNTPHTFTGVTRAAAQAVIQFARSR